MNKVVKIFICAIFSIKLAIIFNATVRRMFYTKRNIVDISDTVYDNGENSFVIMNEVCKSISISFNQYMSREFYYFFLISEKCKVSSVATTL